MKGQTVPKPARAASSKKSATTSTTRTTTSHQTAGRNPKEVALESSLKRKETEQLESFIHNRSKQLDIEIEKMRSKIHEKSLSPSSRRGEDNDDHESRSRRQYLDNLSDEEQEDKWNVRGHHVDRQPRSRSPDQEKKMYDNEERLKRRSEQRENDLYQREVKQRPQSLRDDYGRRNNEGSGGVRDDSDLEDYPNQSRHEGNSNVNRTRDDGQSSSSMARKRDVGYGDHSDRGDMNREELNRHTNNPNSNFRGENRRDGARESQQYGTNAMGNDRNASSRQSNTYSNNDDNHNNNYNNSNDRNRSNNNNNNNYNNNNNNNRQEDPVDNPHDRLLTRLTEAFQTSIHHDKESPETIRDTLLGRAYVKGSGSTQTQIALTDVLHVLEVDYVVPLSGQEQRVLMVSTHPINSP